MAHHKPRSMPVGQRNVLRPNDSASLWNCTLSPGWSRDEADILRKALMRFGIGNWKDIMESGALPGKTNAQLNLQTQRMLGQQSTAEFQLLHIDPLVIGEKNAQIQGPDVKRKNGFIVNSGGKVTKEEKLRRIKENKEKYELPEEEWRAIELPKIDEPSALLQAKEEQIRKLEQELALVRKLIAAKREVPENDENVDVLGTDVDSNGPKRQRMEVV
ncbi:uncharacterized protein EV422DRAFT_306910 [Fimicolochytrium jonesii]|uniref:uncharacterized protein n=1 Tax=Fimicolochytrium jonesii TaxID=1396493 RepID=UPI0022FE7B02|nr:uncharacterized protein EV422DRAFT_306910 [Fimicolochytrium jonesii]KAI8824109.1 hypothetical protein EV422DRAFT_306910 [Fimicolochytrium jonesii]